MSVDKVLIVEDDSSIGMVVRSALEAEGIEVDVCESASARDAQCITWACVTSL